MTLRPGSLSRQARAPARSPGTRPASRGSAAGLTMPPAIEQHIHYHWHGVTAEVLARQERRSFGGGLADHPPQLQDIDAKPLNPTRASIIPATIRAMPTHVSSSLCLLSSGCSR
jgi:hypothetical protein